MSALVDDVNDVELFLGGLMRAQKDAGHSGFFVALPVPHAAGDRLKIDGGEPLASLHMTLLYSKDGTAEQRAAAAKAVSALAAAHLPLKASIGGFGRFPASPQSDGKDVIIGLVDAPMLEAFRYDVVQACQSCGIAPSLAHGFTPHVTLAYVDPAAPSPTPGASAAIEFTELQVDAGNPAPSEMLAQKDAADGDGPDAACCPMCGADPGCNIDCARCMGGEAILIDGFPIGMVMDGVRTVDPMLFYAAVELAKTSGNDAALAKLLEVEKDIIKSAPPGSPGMKQPTIGKAKMRRGAPLKDREKFFAYAKKERCIPVASTQMLACGEELFLLDPADNSRIYGLARVMGVADAAGALERAVTMLGDGEPVCSADLEILSIAPEDTRTSHEIPVAKDRVGLQKAQNTHGPLSYVSHRPGWTFPILDKNVAQQTIMCVAIEPGAVDVHGHRIPEDIADAAMFDFMANYRLRTTRPSSMPATGIGAFHQVKHVPDVHIVQIFKVSTVTGGAHMVVNGKVVPASAWIVVLWVLNKAYWARVLSGEINGVSIDGDAFGGPASA